MIPMSIRHVANKPPSGPNTPPVIRSSPLSIENKNPRIEIPLTGNPKIVPCMKFHPIWRPTGSQSCFVRTYANPNHTPANKIFTAGMKVICGLIKCTREKTIDVNTIAAEEFIPFINA